MYNQQIVLLLMSVFDLSLVYPICYYYFKSLNGNPFLFWRKEDTIRGGTRKFSLGRNGGRRVGRSSFIKPWMKVVVFNISTCKGARFFINLGVGGVWKKTEIFFNIFSKILKAQYKKINIYFRRVGDFLNFFSHRTPHRPPPHPSSSGLGFCGSLFCVMTWEQC